MFTVSRSYMKVKSTHLPLSLSALRHFVASVITSSLMRITSQQECHTSTATSTNTPQTPLPPFVAQACTRTRKHLFDLLLRAQLVAVSALLLAAVGRSRWEAGLFKSTSASFLLSEHALTGL